MLTMSDLWERQADEPDDAFRAFVYFRDMSLPRKVDAYGPFSVAQMFRWHKEWAWPIRARAYDNHLSAFAVACKKEEIAKSSKTIADEHIAILSDLRGMLQFEVAKLVEQSTSSAGNTIMRHGDMVKMLDTVVKLDRLVRGESTEKVETVDLSHMTDEELEAFNELSKKAGGK